VAAWNPQSVWAPSEIESRVSYRSARSRVLTCRKLCFLLTQFISVSYDSHNKQRLILSTELTGWSTECVSREVGTEALYTIQMRFRLQSHPLTASIQWKLFVWDTAMMLHDSCTDNCEWSADSFRCFSPYFNLHNKAKKCLGDLRGPLCSLQVSHCWTEISMYVSRMFCAWPL
jgi:hypothetical protein